jgi:1-acyl-sn-glycerol-3-phosphate acyltransferase
MTAHSLEKSQIKLRKYEHARYDRNRRILRLLMRYVGFTLLAKLNQVEGEENIPATGPAILMINHMAFIDSIVVLNVARRDIVPMAKIEVYDYPVIGIVPHLWGVIPVRREEVDRRAIQQTLEVLRAGELVLVAPEGTRGPAMKQGKVGIAYLASRSNAPIVPVAIDGTIGFPALRFTKAWRGPGASVRFGRPFRFRPEYLHAGHDQLRQMTDEAMYILSALLPPYRRGFYSDLSCASLQTIELV